MFTYLFIFGFPGPSLLCADFLYLGQAELLSSCNMHDSHCGGLSAGGAETLAAMGFSSCGIGAQYL